MNKIGLVGCGNWGKHILRDLLLLGCEVHVAAVSEQTRQDAAQAGALQVYLDYEQLPECDGYVVATPIPDLSTVCAGLLKRKKPIFSEKTLCSTIEDYQRLYDLGGQDYIFVMHKWRYHPGIEALRVAAQDGIVGRVEEICTQRHAWTDNLHGGDIFSALAVHDLTIIKHILGYIPNDIRAINIISNKEGLPVSFTAMLGSSPTVVMSINSRHSSKRSGVSIHGDKGTAELYHAYDDHIKVRNEDGESKVPIDTTFPLYIELKEFIAYLDGGAKPRCGLDEAKEVASAIAGFRKFKI
jgi:predicted dehydrogenase